MVWHWCMNKQSDQCNREKSLEIDLDIDGTFVYDQDILQISGGGLVNQWC